MNQMEKPPLLLIGASVRAAAQSARRAGFEPFAIDLFGDRDLRQIAQSRIVTDYPHGIPAIARDMPEAPFLYTGALENSPEVLAELSLHRTLWGNDPRVIERVRNPFRLQAFLKESSFPIVPLRTHDDPPADPAGWLAKPFSSAHGSGIRRASGQPVKNSFYFQRLLAGDPVGAAFLSDGTACRLLGTHRQLVGLMNREAHPFQFCGAAAPARLTAEMTRTISEIGTSLVRWSGMTGLFGCDFVVNPAGAFLLEVNPRYTAAMELWETLCDRSLIGDHVRACRDGILPEPTACIPAGNVLKLILYAPQSTTVPDRLEDAVRSAPDVWLADLPDAGSTVACHHPLCTLLAFAGPNSALDSALNAAIHSVGCICGWSEKQLETICHDVSERITAEFT